MVFNFQPKLLFLLVLSAALWGCGSNTSDTPSEQAEESLKTPESQDTQEPTICPDKAKAPRPLPGVTEEHRQLDYWLTQIANDGDLDEILLSVDAIDEHNQAMASELVPLHTEAGYAAFKAKIDERFTWYSETFKEKSYFEADGQAMQPSDAFDLARLPAKPATTMHLVLNSTQVHCAPRAEPFYKEGLDLRFNRNNCSTARAQEVIEVVADWGNGLLLARTRYTWGWIEADTPLSPELSPEELARFSLGPFAIAGEDLEIAGHTFLLGTRLPLLDGKVRFGTATGIEEAPRPAVMLEAPRPLTRRDWYSFAFKFLDSPYGWGGEGGARDCSRLIMDLAASFGLELPRHSASIAKAGTFSIDLSEVDNLSERLLLLDAAARRGVVLLHFPGHIMLYLGRDQAGEAMILHSFAEYVEPCSERDPARPEAAETLMMVDRVSISDLHLGKDSSRTSFIERMTTITVLGKAPGPELAGVAKLRQASPAAIPESCKDSQSHAIFRSPLEPGSDQEMRVIITTSEEMGPVGLTLYDPAGSAHSPELERYGGPPFGWVAKVDKPAAGTWTAVFGDGPRVDACYKIRVRDRVGEAEAGSTGAWENRRRWTEATENLYAIWVEALVSYPADEDLSWTSLHDLTSVAEKNLLFNFLGHEEDTRLKMEPDCADLPYMLRAYFAWKMGLPYGYRRCSRGKAGRPPKCGGILSNSSAEHYSDPVKGFANFANGDVRNGVHSASGRTHPDNDASDYYPIPITRDALRPGTLYADPYGHLLVVAKWLPQTTTDYGVLVAVDAQPDGTVGRRRFWRGSFLFTPETEDVGAGFKAMRPVFYDNELGDLVALTNRELQAHDTFTPYSTQQYEGSADDFYLAVEGLINPRPLDPHAMQASLVDALSESVTRRVVSVNNGEAWVTEHNGATVPMPNGYSIFETSGPWEDFSTPSRDMRLLISIDTVMNFVKVMRRAPERFGETADSVEAAIAQVEQTRQAALDGFTFEYTKSDGSSQSLSLSDVVARAEAFEVAYHPNDCIEIRWGAPEGSDEMTSCKRHAPKDARAKMADYRQWFIDRKRPPR